MPREVVYDPYGKKSSGLGVTGEAIHPSEVLERHGTGGNAEVLIQAVREHNPPELQSAGLKKVDFDATKALRAGEHSHDSIESWDDVAAIAGEGATLHDVKVRSGGIVTYSAADSQGTLYKGTFNLSDPEGSHISQAELLGRADSVAAPIVGARRAGREAAENAARAAIQAREQALAKRERELMEKEKELEELRISDSERRAREEAEAQGDGEPDGGDGDGEPVERPASLPDNYDELDAKEAAKVVHELEGDEREQAVAYERANKGRKSVTGDES